MIPFAWVFLLTFARTAAISVSTVAEGFFGRLSRGRVDALLSVWSQAILRYAGIRLVVRGRENLDPYSAMVIMSNHESHYDIPALFQALPPSLRMIAKKELFLVPLWGRAMRTAGFIEIDRSNRESAVRSLRFAQAQLKSGIQIWIAPEGTRSRTGRLLPFKRGGFILSQEMGLPILPVSIRGTRDVLPAKTLRLKRGVEVVITIHPRIAIPENGSREEWMEQVRRALERGL